MFFAAGEHCWLTYSLLPTRTSRTFSTELLPGQSVPCLSWHCIKGFLLPRQKNLYLSFQNFIIFPVSPFLQPVWVYLNDSPALEHINRSPCLVPPANWTSVHSHLLQNTEEDVKQDMFQDRSLQYSVCYQCRVQPNTHQPLSLGTQSVLNSLSCTSIQGATF